MLSMASSKHHPTHLSRSELTFWKDVFKVAVGTNLLKNGRLQASEGVAHLAAERASASVRELRNIKRTGI